jgi:outer membrane protein assembly factor BamB
MSMLVCDQRTKAGFLAWGRWIVGCTFTAFLPAVANAETCGWRGDGTGRFTTAQPPTNWSQNSDNILWKIPVGSGYSSPVVSGNRLFLTAPPSDVICFDAGDGTERWRQTVDYKVALGEALANQITKTQADLESEKRAIGKQLEQLRKSDPQSPELEQLKQQQKQVEDRRREFQRQYQPEKRGGAGNTAATIICDGERLFAMFGTGIITALNVDGTRLWARHLETPQEGFGHAASPLLAGGHLIVHIQQLTALDPATGKTVWRTDLPAKFGTPAVARIDGQDVLITPSGAVVAAEDGRLLATKQFQLSHNSPLLHDGIIYAHESGKVKAFRLPDSLASPVELELLWETSGARDQRMSSAVFHDGLLYAVGRRGILDVTDATTGESVYRKRLDIGEFFASPALAGGLIFSASRNGETLVLRPGRAFDQVALNPLERASATPLFAERRMYLRTDKALYCIGE